MSYCRFENTMDDLRDCIRNIYREAENERDERSRQEMIALFMEVAEEFVKSMIRFGIDVDGEICKAEGWFDFTDIVNEYMPHFDRFYFKTLD